LIVKNGLLKIELDLDGNSIKILKSLKNNLFCKLEKKQSEPQRLIFLAEIAKQSSSLNAGSFSKCESPANLMNLIGKSVSDSIDLKKTSCHLSHNIEKIIRKKTKKSINLHHKNLAQIIGELKPIDFSKFFKISN
jgi:hypothetical protein